MQNVNIIDGIYNNAKVFANIIEPQAYSQILHLMDQPFVENESIAIMPDVHSGSGCTIGYTQTINNGKVCPNLVGVDIACGMLTIKLGKCDIDFNKFDNIVNRCVPSGRNVHDVVAVDFNKLENLNCYKYLKEIDRLRRSVGTLGGGNHFIEIDTDEEQNKYLVIHSGSRNLGKQVAEYYQELADKSLNHNFQDYYDKRNSIINFYKASGKSELIENALKQLDKRLDNNKTTEKDLAYLQNENLLDYLEDVDICTSFAFLNRNTIANIILDKYFAKTLDDFENFTTLHNYIDTENKILRKGAVSAKKDELILVPINMRDGSLLCKGKGNEDYNFSAPHGAGRLMSRTKAMESITLEQFQDSMKDVFSTSVTKNTIDESPFAYKSINDILPMLEQTATVLKVIKPLYNFKAKN